jgi:hypothetical protein
MLVFWKNTCKTRRIHIGMDETHDLGRGRYLDKNGYKHGFELFNKHLAKVTKLCKKHDLKPMIWSDMYFRLGSKNRDYYDLNSVIPKNVIDKISPDAELVYWDYYHGKKEFYLEMIDRHRKMNKEPLVGSGIWTWDKYWYDSITTEKNAGACVDACYEAKIKELFFTQWGDNGAYCDHDSAFAGMVFCADKSYGTQKPAKSKLEKRFASVCGGSYAAHIIAAKTQGGVRKFNPNMWDDPIYETHLRNKSNDSHTDIAKVAKGFATIANQLEAHKDDRATGDLLYGYHMAKAFASRYGLFAEMLGAYRKKDRRTLKKLTSRIPAVVADIQNMELSFRNMWLCHNKPEGLETIQARFGMLEARYRELTRRLNEYASGKIESIPEFEYKCPPA